MSPSEQQHDLGPDPGAPGPAENALRRSTLILTNFTKVVGLIVVVNETLLRPTIRESALAVAGAMIFGAQTVENVLVSLIERMFGAGRS